VPDEVLSDAWEAVCDADFASPEVEVLIQEVIRKRFATDSRRRRRFKIRHLQFEIDVITNKYDPIAAASAQEARRLIAYDDFDKEAIAASLREHSDFMSFAEFARNQKYCSKSHAYKRRYALQQRLREVWDLA
jgi:hypothetical protein